jgi:hypothetical protein
MTIETKDLFQTAIALSVYISAVRIYAETQINNAQLKSERKDVIKVLLFFITIPDILMIVTSLGALHSLIFDVEINDVFISTFIAGVITLVALHVIEWARNIRRFFSLQGKCSALSKYFK